jgi:hypothetical protein
MKTNTSNQLASMLVFHYSTYHSRSKSYLLNIKNIPEFELHELAALLIKEEPELAKEATSVDNPYYETIMLPALLKHMECSTNNALRNDFDEAWLDGITLYLEQTMQNLIDDQCRERAFIQKESTNYYPVQNRNTGEIEWRI